MGVVSGCVTLQRLGAGLYQGPHGANHAEEVTWLSWDSSM